MAGARAAVGGGAGRRSDELPVVAGVVEGQLDYSKGPVVADLAVRRNGHEAVAAPAPHARRDLTDSAGWVVDTGRRLGREAFVEVLVPAEHEVSSSRVEGVPERAHRLAVVRIATRGEARTVEEGKRAGVGMGEVGAQPARLWRVGPTAAGPGALRIECRHVPSADIEAVVARRTIAGLSHLPARAVEVVEIARGTRVVVLVVAGNGPDQRLETAPGGLERLVEGRELPGLVL